MSANATMTGKDHYPEGMSMGWLDDDWMVEYDVVEDQVIETRINDKTQETEQRCWHIGPDAGLGLVQ